MITIETLEKAIEFAVDKHKGQERKSDKMPYILHPFAVMSNLRKYKDSSKPLLLASAAILHDTVEDCDVKLEEIAEKFGFQVASLVDELTLDKTQYEVIGKKEYLSQHMNNMSSYALAIKLCDRLDNISDLDKMPKKFKENYIQETKYILDNLKVRKLTKTHKRLIGHMKKTLNKY